ncbi:hypothetical protein B0H19DRAFT_1231057 [Mycena capillaripes]|nr:hypothetical protein B0H19DRAFT_1231057 [Mycena capillaripes]
MDARSGVDFNPEGAASRLRSRLAEIDGTIVSLEAQLEQLHTERQLVSDNLHAILCLILTIPPELTAEIFWHCVQPDEYDNIMYPGPSSLRMALTLSSVCGAWRTVALSTCAIWTRIHFDAQRIRDAEKVLSCCLSRAGVVPLDLRLNLAGSKQTHDAILSVLAQHSSQWMSLDLRSDELISFSSDSIQGPLSSLKKLSINTRRTQPFHWEAPVTVFPDAPHLREVHIGGLSLAQISLPWMHLTSLDLVGQTLGQCFDILGLTPNPTTLRVAMGEFFEADPVTSQQPLTLPYLHTIKMSDDWYSSTLFQYLVVPALECLELKDYYSNCADRVASLVARSGCSIRTLSFQCGGVFQAEELMSVLPTLRDLTLKCHSWDADDMNLFFKDMSSRADLVPALESLKLEKWVLPIEVSCVSDMVWTPGEGRDRVVDTTAFSLSVGPKIRGLSDTPEAINAIVVRAALRLTAEYYAKDF